MTRRNVSERLAIAARQNTKEKEFWTKQLSGNLVKTGFPYDYHKINVNEYEYNIESKAFQLVENRDGEFFSRLMELIKGSDYALNLVLIASLILLLNKYSGNKDIIVATPIYKQNVEGEFINTVLVLRNPIENNQTFKEFLLQVRQTIMKAVENKNYPIELLIEMENLQVDGFEKDSSLFDVAILLENIHKKEYLMHVNCNMTFSFTRQASSIKAILEYNSLLYEETTIEKIIVHLKNLLQNALFSLDSQLSQLEMLTGEEKREILYDFNRTRREYPKEKTVHQWFAEQVDKTPDHIAVSSPIDLTEIYDQLQSETIKPGMKEKMNARCFRKNPYICQYNLKLSTDNNHTPHLNILKTHRHNSVIINENMSKLLASFDGNKNLRSIYSQVKELEKRKGLHPEFLIYSMSKVDLLEVSFQLNHQPEIFVIHGFEDLLKLVQCLYRNHLIELVGVGSEESFFKDTLIRDFAKDTGLTLTERVTPEHILAKDRERGTVEVLLLGDTPGLSTTGLLYLASYLKRKGIETVCQLYDQSRDHRTMKGNIEKLLETLQPTIVAISLKWFPYIARVLDMCEIVKQYARRNSREIKVVVGGNTASYYWEDLIKFDAVDCLIRGDGEEPLWKICQGEEESNIPNCVYKRNGRIVENPLTYVQDEVNSSEIYLSHLQEILLSPHASRFGTFFIYTHKGCAMNCLYCGGCNQAQQKIFNRKSVFERRVREVRNDITTAEKYVSTIQFQFDIPDKNLTDYCQQIWEGIELSGHFCIFSTLTPPSESLIQLVSRTFKYVYWDFDVCTPSQRHREQLFSLGLVKPQPSDKEILDFMARCEKYNNIEVRLNLITGLPYFTLEDIEAGERLLSKIMNTYSCFSELHWARLHAQPGAPIVETAGKHHMNSYATTFKDFLKFSRGNFSQDSPYARVEDLNYPYIYFKDDRLNSSVTNFYLETNRKVDQIITDRRQALIVCDTLSYRELNEKAEQLAGLLQARGLMPGKIAALMLERSIEIPVGILGILKAGCAYIPIDPGFPVGRIQYILNDSNVKALVTNSKLAEEDEKLRSLEVKRSQETIFIDTLDATNPSSSQLLNFSTSPSSLAYIIYTSGTTGRPKGVLLTHKNLVNYVHWFTNAANLTEKDKTLLTSSFAFDLGYTSLYSSLLNGGELHILPREIYLLGERLVDYIRQKEISYIKVTPSLFSVIVHSPNFSAAACKSLGVAVVGGEAINVEDIETAHNRCPHLRIMNHYGPTEATIGCVTTFVDFNEFEAYKKHPVIGSPIHNTGIYILGKDLNLLPVGVPGELGIAGTCLSRGYLNQPQLTAERFIKAVIGHSLLVIGSSKKCYKFTNDRSSHSPIPPSPPFPIYRTGDLARWLPNGTIEFLGRIDKQVKVRGYRIELAEIESRLRKHHNIEDALVVVKEEEEGDKYLCAYIVPKIGKVEGKSISTPPAARKISAVKEVVKEDTEQIPSFVRCFEEAVKKNHDKIAVKSDDGSLTYDALNKYANRVAHKILHEYDDRYKLSKSERLRYKRQMLLHGWGIASQEKLKSTTVFIAGAGGGASPTIMQLALIGFGTLKVCDFDEIELSNLNRQFLHDEERLGMNKAVSTKLTVSKANPHVNVIPYTQELTRENVCELVGDSAIIFDMFDGPADKFILSEYAVVKGIPHLILAMTDINAYAAVFHPPHTPCYHCIFDKEKLEVIVSGMQYMVGKYSMNPLPVVSTSLFISSGTIVNEALKILLGFDKPAYNKFLYFNQRGATRDLAYTPGYRAMTQLFSDHFLRTCKEQGFDWDVGWREKFLEELNIKPDPNCPVCGIKGKKIQKTVENRMKKAKEASIPVEVKEKEEMKKKSEKKTQNVALFLKRDIDMVVGLLGILKAGKTSVPLEPTFSMERLAFILEDSESRIIVTDDEHFNRARKLRDQVNKNIKVINISRIEESNANMNNVVETGIQPVQVANVLYPPHSTGNTGPITESHKSILNFVDTYTYNLQITSTQGLYFLSSLGSNAGMIDLFAALLNGTGSYVFENKENKKEVNGNAVGASSLSLELKEFLSEELPDYMVPAHYVQLEQIPLTPNEKVDRNALPDPLLEIDNGYTPPRNHVEEKLVEIWSQLLGKDRDTIGIDTNFFQLGGHSLNATVMVARIHKELNLKLSLAEVFASSTIRALAELVKPAEEEIYVSIESTEKKEYYPLSSAQNRMYLMKQLIGDNLSYNTPEVYMVEGPLYKERFEKVVKMLIERHEAFRTSFEMVENIAVQKVHPSASVKFQLKYHAIEGIGNMIEQRVETMIHDFIRPFDLAKVPLLRVGLVKLPGQKHLLIYDFHHIIRDIVSTKIFIKEFINLYEGVELTPLRLQYKDFSVWQNHLFQSGAIKKQEAYWFSVFYNEIPSLNMPLDYPRPEMLSFKGDCIEFEFGSDITGKLKHIQKESGATLFMVVLALYTILLSKYSGQEDIVVGSPTAGRSHTDLEHVVGIFLNTLALRNYPKNEKTYIAFLKEVKENTLNAFENQDYQFENLLSKLNIKPNPNRHPLFDTMLAWQNVEMNINVTGKENEVKAIKGLSITSYKHKDEISQFDIIIYAGESNNNIWFVLRYCTALFERETIERFTDHFREIANSVANDKYLQLKDIKISLDYNNSASGILSEAESNFVF